MGDRLVKVTELPTTENARQRGWTHTKQIETLWNDGTREVARMTFTQAWKDIEDMWDVIDLHHTYYSKFYPSTLNQNQVQ